MQSVEDRDRIRRAAARMFDTPLHLVSRDVQRDGDCWLVGNPPNMLVVNDLDVERQVQIDARQQARQEPVEVLAIDPLDDDLFNVDTTGARAFAARMQPNGLSTIGARKWIRTLTDTVDHLRAELQRAVCAKMALEEMVPRPHEWTSTPPTKEGLYQYVLDSFADEVSVGRVWQDPQGKWWLAGCDTGGNVRAPRPHLWGPEIAPADGWQEKTDDRKMRAGPKIGDWVELDIGVGPQTGTLREIHTDGTAAVELDRNLGTATVELHKLSLYIPF